MAKKQESSHKLLSDEPVESVQTDTLTFGPAAQVLAQAALHTASPKSYSCSWSYSCSYSYS